MQRCKTLEELKEMIDKYCSSGYCDGRVDNDLICIKYASRELRNEYAAKYGCICGCSCSKCCERKSGRCY